MNCSTRRFLKFGAELTLVYFIMIAPNVTCRYGGYLIFPPQETYYWFLSLIFSGIGIWILSRLLHASFFKSFGTEIRFSRGSFVLFCLFLLSIVIIQFVNYHLVLGRDWAPRWIWTWDKKTFLILGVLVQAFQEEWIFRGYLFARLLPDTRWERTFLGIPVNSTIIITTVLFALAHAWIGPWKMLWALYPGFFLGALRQKTGNIFLPFVCHALVNLWDRHFFLPRWLG